MCLSVPLIPNAYQRLICFFQDHLYKLRGNLVITSICAFVPTFCPILTTNMVNLCGYRASLVLTPLRDRLVWKVHKFFFCVVPDELGLSKQLCERRSTNTDLYAFRFKRQ